MSQHHPYHRRYRQRSQRTVYTYRIRFRSQPSPLGQGTALEVSKPPRTRFNTSDSCTSSSAPQAQPGAHFSEVEHSLNAPSRPCHQENAEKSSKSSTAHPSSPAAPLHAPSSPTASEDRTSSPEASQTSPASPLPSEKAPDSPKPPSQLPKAPADSPPLPAMRTQSETLQDASVMPQVLPFSPHVSADLSSSPDPPSSTPAPSFSIPIVSRSASTPKERLAWPSPPCTSSSASPPSSPMPIPPHHLADILLEAACLLQTVSVILMMLANTLLLPLPVHLRHFHFTADNSTPAADRSATTVTADEDITDTPHRVDPMLPQTLDDAV
ncbi:hypothetical protein BD779DRAFT_1670386 [Infundibulicybe gibba]|nr:hypothetical protein BD779DRAFT_1670386 [Infundibulicybe gibba]